MSTQAALTDFDALMDASLDDLDDLPPIGVPPNGNYTFEVKAERKTPEKGGNDYISVNFKVVEVNELAEGEDPEGAAAGQQFYEMFSPFKKDGGQNPIGLGKLKERLAPFSAHFGVSKIGETLVQMGEPVTIVANLKRRADKKEEGRYFFNLSDVTVL